MTGRVVAVTPEDMRAVAEAAVGHQTYPGLPADVAPVVDMFTREVIA